MHLQFFLEGFINTHPKSSGHFCEFRPLEAGIFCPEVNELMVLVDAQPFSS